MKFSQNYFCVALARSAYVLRDLEVLIFMENFNGVLAWNYKNHESLV